MPSRKAAERFDGTAEYYARYRPGYGGPAFAYLAERFDLDDQTRVLDLGCGTGHVAIPVAGYAGEVVGMDPNEEMLAVARERAVAAGRENVEWVRGSDSDLDESLGPVRLATLGRSFHWMDQERTLERLFRMADPKGGVAILTDRDWLLRGEEEWQADVYDVAGGYLDDLPERTGPEVEYDDPWDELVAEHGFTDVEVTRFESRREWTVERIVGYVFSLSFGSPRRFGDDAAAFEAAVRERLADRGERPFVQDATVEVITGRRESAD